MIIKVMILRVLRFASTKVSWIKTNFSNVVSVQQPAQESFKSEAITKMIFKMKNIFSFIFFHVNLPSVRTCSKFPLVCVPIVWGRIQSFFLVGFH